MFFALDAPRRLLQDAVGGFAAAHSSEQLVRVAMTQDGLPTGWTELHDVLAETGTHEPDLVDRAAVLEILGGALYPGPVLTCALAARMLTMVAADDPATRLRDGLRTGRTVVVLVRPRTTDTVVVSGDGSAQLTGSVTVVVDATVADVLLIAAGADAADGWYEVPVDAAGLRVHALTGLDQTRRLGAVTLTGTPARRIRLGVDDHEAWTTIGLVEQALVAVDDTGVARHCLRTGVAYAREREQFGRPIGSFQALQHLLADAAHEVESAWAAAFEAVWTLEHAPERAPRSVALAASVAGDAALHTAELMMQVHGGVGFTWDNPSHLYLKRAKANRLLWGGADRARAQLADLLEL